jgi:hypothetical protein
MRNNSNLTIAATLLVLCAHMQACSEPIDDSDDTAPRVIAVSPGTRNVSRDGVIEVSFSEAMRRATLNEESVVVVATTEVSENFVSDLSSPPLSESRQARLVPISLQPINGDRTLSISASAGFPAAQQLTLLISAAVTDLVYNPLVGHDGLAATFRYDFVTDDGNPQVSGTSLPAGNPAEVPVNLRSIEVFFDQAVNGVDRDSLALLGLDGAAAPEIIAIEVTSDRLSAKIRLGLSSQSACYTMCPQASYKLIAGTGIVDDDNIALAAYSKVIQASAPADLSSPSLVLAPIAIASEDSALIRWETDEASSSAVRLGDSATALSRWVIGPAASTCEGSGAAARCVHEVRVDGLDLGTGAGRTYYYAIESVDNFANPPMVAGPYIFETLRLPRLAVNEVYVNPPPGPANESEADYEFVEIFNFSTTESYDLSTFSLREIDGSAALDLTAMHDGGSTSLAPGAYAVIGARDRLNTTALAVPASALLLTDAVRTRTTLLGGLKNSVDTRKQIGLYQGLVSVASAPLVSSYSAPAALYDSSGNFPEGVSAERLGPSAPDLDSSWCHGQGAPTPGLANSVLGLSTCP